MKYDRLGDEGVLSGLLESIRNNFMMSLFLFCQF